MQVNKDFYSVSEVNQLLSTKIENDLTFQLMLVVGEIVNYKQHSSGHIYFTLKDEDSRLKCVMFKSQARYLSFNPTNGQQILVQGRLGVYEKYGEYQLYVDSLYKMGFGDLRQKYLRLKSKLQEKGYFDESHKKKLPKYPKIIGVITSSTGAVIHDIIRTLNERYPMCEVILFPANVQGEKASENIIECFKEIKNYDLDLLILGRGGGSEEELWVFNEEKIVKAIYDCKIPIITAIGHEVDVTLSDLAADISVATPTAAAVAATPDISQVIRDFDYLEENIIKVVESNVKELKQNLTHLERKLNIYEPNNYIVQLKNKMELKRQYLSYYVNNYINTKKNELKSRENMLENLYIKKASFPKVYDEGNKTEISSLNEIELGSFLNILFKDGSVKVKTVKKEGFNYGKHVN